MATCQGAKNPRTIRDVDKDEHEDEVEDVAVGFGDTWPYGSMAIMDTYVLTRLCHKCVRTMETSRGRKGAKTGGHRGVGQKEKTRRNAHKRTGK